MRKFILTMLVFALLLGSASAQAELAKPKMIDVQTSFFGRCIGISWNRVLRAATYEVRVTKKGVGRLNYRPGVSEEDQIRNWTNWRDLREPMKYGSNKKYGRSVDWCGLASGQTVKVRVRAVGKDGEIGPSSKPIKFRVIHNLDG